MQTISDDDVRSTLDRQGYVIVDDVLPEAKLDRMLEAMATRTADYARAVADGGGPAAPSGTLAEQLIELVRNGQTWPGQVLDIALPQGGIAADTPIFLDQAAFDLLTDPALLDLVQRFVGPQIWLSPVGHTRAKLPQSVAPSDNGRFGVTAWHQDNGVLLPEADDVDILTVWFPLSEVTADNGCMCVVPTRRGAQLIEHCATDVGIPEANMPADEPVALPMRRGSVLLLHDRTVHASMPNRTAADVRISMDLRYQSAQRPTGRPMFPSVLVRSPDEQAVPATWSAWRAAWFDTRRQLADKDLGPFNRWSRTEGCA